jgi:hypothetical protein
MTRVQTVKWILRAPEEEIFPKDGISEVIYRRLAKFCHPDTVHDDALKTEAASAFRRLTELYQKHNGKPKDEFKTSIIGKWVVEEPLAKGDIADLYVASPTISWPSPLSKAVFKIARSPKDNDLIKAEADALTKLHADKHPSSGPFKEYIPQLYETFVASGRRVNVITKPEGYHSLAQIIELFPDGLEFRHVVWMGNRLFSALGFAHRNGIIHGAVLPQHLLYHPTTHGLLLVGWGQCVDATVKGARVQAVSKDYRFLYPKEVAAKRMATPALDIYMAALTLLKAADANVPRRMRSLFDWCRAESPSARPQDAWELQDRWRALAKEEYGKPKYLELKLPVM